MKALLKDNRVVIGLYTLIILVLSFFLLNYEKVQIHVFLNQFVGNRILDWFFYYITFLGDGGLAPVILLLIFLYNVRLGICATISFLLAAITTNVLKYWFFPGINRPWFVFQWYVETPLKYVDTEFLHIHNSFPSGHATQAFAIFICLSLFAKNNINKILFLLVAVISAFSRVYLSQHWLVDVTAGSVIGTITAMLLYYSVITKNKFNRLDTPLFKLKRS